MHPYELAIMSFMKTVSKSSVSVNDMLLKPAEADLHHYLTKMMEEDPNRPFSIRMSSIGRPLCQQQMHKAKAACVEDDWNFPLRMMYGAIIEGLTVSILRHSGIKIDEEQTNVKLKVQDIAGLNVYVPGKLDIVLEGTVWDIKSASSYSYKEKFKSYDTLKENDDFGYVAQLYGYSAARGLPPGGWIVVDKSSGEVKVITVPADYKADMQESLQLITNNVQLLLSNAKFKRCFEDKNETFKKRFTGNKVLEAPCTFCKYKYSCWPNLQYLPVQNSAAYEKPYKYYTYNHNETEHEEANAYLQPQSQRPTTSEANSL